MIALKDLWPRLFFWVTFITFWYEQKWANLKLLARVLYVWCRSEFPIIVTHWTLKYWITIIQYSNPWNYIFHIQNSVDNSNIWFFSNFKKYGFWRTHNLSIVSEKMKCAKILWNFYNPQTLKKRTSQRI